MNHDWTHNQIRALGATLGGPDLSKSPEGRAAREATLAHRFEAVRLLERIAALLWDLQVVLHKTGPWLYCAELMNRAEFRRQAVLRDIGQIPLPSSRRATR